MKQLQERFREIEQLGRAQGLDPYDVHYFKVPASLIYQIASYGLPTRYSHWSFGSVHQQTRIHGEMGFSKIYELILNCDPCLAFLDETNTDTTNLLIAAHCLGHSAFFKNNILFRQCGETNMVNVAKRHADIIDQFRSDYGDDEVDEWLDIALSLERHIDIYRGHKRSRYPQRHIEYVERIPDKWDDIVHRDPSPSIKKVMENIYLPPDPERDILWFLSEYANLETWQQKIFQIVRRESYYFFPQYRTKILNEGYASYWHAELMHQYFLGKYNDYNVPINKGLTDEEHLDFLVSHEKVVQPGLKIKLKVDEPELDDVGRPTGKIKKQWNRKLNSKIFNAATRINPYYVGFRMLRDIKDKWDKYKEEGYREDEWGKKIPVTINGTQKIHEVMMEEDDVSFFRKYLTEELVSELHLFTIGNSQEYSDNYDIQERFRSSGSDNDDFVMPNILDQMVANKTIQVCSKEVKDIIKSFAQEHNNYGVPSIVIRRVDESGVLRIEHLKEDKINLDIAYAEQVMKYIHRVWGRSVELIRKGENKDKTWVMSYDGMSFEIGHEAYDYPECVEKIQHPSSW